MKRVVVGGVAAAVVAIAVVVGSAVVLNDRGEPSSAQPEVGQVATAAPSEDVDVDRVDDTLDVGDPSSVVEFDRSAPTVEVTATVDLGAAVGDDVTLSVGGREPLPVDDPLDGTADAVGLVTAYDEAGNIAGYALAPKTQDDLHVNVSHLSTAVALVVGTPGLVSSDPDTALLRIIAAAVLPEVEALAEHLEAEQAADPAYLSYSTAERTQLIGEAAEALFIDGGRTDKRVAQADDDGVTLNDVQFPFFPHLDAGVSCDVRPALAVDGTNALDVCLAPAADGYQGTHRADVPLHLMTATNYLPRWVLGVPDGLDVPVTVIRPASLSDQAWENAFRSLVGIGDNVTATIGRLFGRDGEPTVNIDDVLVLTALDAMERTEPRESSVAVLTNTTTTLRTLGGDGMDNPYEQLSLLLTATTELLVPTFEVAMDVAGVTRNGLIEDLTGETADCQPEEGTSGDRHMICGLIEILQDAAVDAVVDAGIDGDPSPEEVLDILMGAVVDLGTDPDTVVDLLGLLYEGVSLNEIAAGAVANQMSRMLAPWVAVAKGVQLAVSVNDLAYTIGTTGQSLVTLVTDDRYATEAVYRTIGDPTYEADAPIGWAPFSCGDVRYLIDHATDATVDAVRAHLAGGPGYVDMHPSDATFFAQSSDPALVGSDELFIVSGVTGNGLRVVQDGFVQIDGVADVAEVDFFPVRFVFETAERAEDGSDPIACFKSENFDPAGYLRPTPIDAAASAPSAEPTEAPVASGGGGGLMSGENASNDDLREALMLLVDAARAGDRAAMEQYATDNVVEAILDGSSALEFAADNHRDWYRFDDPFTTCEDFSEPAEVTGTGLPVLYFECYLAGESDAGQDTIFAGWAYFFDEERWYITVAEIPF